MLGSPCHFERDLVQPGLLGAALIENLMVFAHVVAAVVVLSMPQWSQLTFAAPISPAPNEPSPVPFGPLFPVPGPSVFAPPAC